MPSMQQVFSFTELLSQLLSVRNQAPSPRNSLQPTHPPPSHAVHEVMHSTNILVVLQFLSQLSSVRNCPAPATPLQYTPPIVPTPHCTYPPPGPRVNSHSCRFAELLSSVRNRPKPVPH